MDTDKITLYDIILAPLFIVGAGYAIYDAVRDMRRGENRPVVTNDMIDAAFEDMLIRQSDAEMENMDWMSDDDDDE